MKKYITRTHKIHISKYHKYFKTIDRVYKNNVRYTSMTKLFTKEQIGYFGKPNFTKEDLLIEKMQRNRMISLGIKIPTSFNNTSISSDDYTKDELEALEYIYTNRALPEDLEQRLLDALKNKITTQQVDYEINLDDATIQKFLGE